MTQDEILEAIKKLRYQVSVLGQAIDSEKHPVESLIVEMDWSFEDLNRVHDIFEKWEKKIEDGEDMNTAKFEAEFLEQFQIDYQSLKSIVLAFYENGQWTNVCEAYVDAFGDRASVEYHSIMRRQR